MEEKKIKKKFKAYFHDPVFKALILTERKGHEKVAEDIYNFLFPQKEEEEEFNEENIKKADHIASASDRLFLPTGKYLNLNFKKSSEIIHPFSSDKNQLYLKDLESINRDEYQKIVPFLLKAISKEENDEELFLLLWELYPEILNQVFKVENKVIENLPADTRFPDHSIWEHLSTTSAIATALPEPAFLIFSISPVQSFIMNAKKTRDFWLGSYMLSYLTWVAIDGVINSFGPDSIIFPDLHKQPLFLKERIKKIIDKKLNNENSKIDESVKKVIEKLQKKLENIDLKIPSMPNRFLSIVDYKEGRNLTSNIEDKLKGEIKNIGKKIIKFIEDKGVEIDDEFENTFKRQIKNFFNFSSVLVPWSLDKENTSNIKFEKVKEKIENIFGEEFFKDTFEFLTNIDKLKKYEYNVGVLYPILYDISERFSASQKSLRIIENNEAEKYHKCTLCGEREALHLKGEFGWDDLSNLWANISEKLEGIISPEEKLCGVCLTKRLFSKYFGIKERFPSTADVSTASFKIKVIEKDKNDNDKIKDILKEIIEKIESMKPVRERGDVMGLFEKFKEKIHRSDILRNFIMLNGELLYKNLYKKLTRKGEKEENIKRNFLNFSKEKAKEVMDLIKKLEDKINFKPSKYYAIIKFDGDRMGKILKGELNNQFFNSYHTEIQKKIEENDEYKDFVEIIKNNSLKRPMSPAIHRLISRALRNFSLKFVKEAVEKYGNGKVIYAGGDDVFALLPLERFFETINLLRAFYSGEVSKGNNEWKVNYGEGNGWIDKDENSYITLGKNATASLGAAIVHWEEPLSLAIKLADEAEKEAKNSGRNAFCIKFKRRSGEIRSSVFNWYYLYNDGKRYDFIRELVNWFFEKFRNEELSPNFIQTLKLEFSKLWDNKVKESKREKNTEITELFIEEFLMRLGRSLNKMSKEEKEEIMDELKEKLKILKDSEPSSSKLWRKISPFHSIKKFLHLIETIHFVSKEGESA